MASRLVTQLGTHSVAGASAGDLADQIRALILDGRLTVGERLPSERALAAELRRSRSTITRAYDALESDRYVTRLHGGGTRVALPNSPGTVTELDDDASIDLSIASMDSTPGLYDATVRSLPRLAALRGTSGYSLQGLPELRDAVAARFSQRGAPTSAEEIMITSGALNAVNLILTAFGRRGERAVVEQPTFPHALDALQLHGYRMLPTPVDVQGWDAGHLLDLLLRARPHVGYLIPDFHNPTGATLSDEDRSRIAATARSSGTRLIIDETTAELDIDRGWTPTPMGAFGPHVITVGSMSKIAWEECEWAGSVRSEPTSSVCSPYGRRSSSARLCSSSASPSSCSPTCPHSWPMCASVCEPDVTRSRPGWATSRASRCPRHPEASPRGWTSAGLHPHDSPSPLASTGSSCRRDPASRPAACWRDG
ncbi:PLP-dependent aminotransferase family protein [Microbacterium sp. KUDC0406]|nr:PLP-dependent aminotransferase family protein [Microbacterium sp. KUDC0406]